MRRFQKFSLPLWGSLTAAVLLAGGITLLALWCQPNALRSVLSVFRAQPLLIVLLALIEGKAGEGAKAIIERPGAQLLQLCPERGIGRGVLKDKALGYSADIKSGSADQEGLLSAGQDAVNGGVGPALEVGH